MNESEQRRAGSDVMRTVRRLSRVYPYRRLRSPSKVERVGREFSASSAFCWPRSIDVRRMPRSVGITQRGQIYIGHIISLPNLHDKEKSGLGSKTVGSPNIHFEQVPACDASSRASLSASQILLDRALTAGGLLFKKALLLEGGVMLGRRG